MRLDTGGDTLTLVLSERNLRTLLAKLEGHPPNSKCMIQGGTQAAFIFVKAEKDEVHYADRPDAGVMHPDTEAALAGRAD